MNLLRRVINRRIKGKKKKERTCHPKLPSLLLKTL
jgi:hypothetical protein